MLDGFSTHTELTGWPSGAFCLVTSRVPSSFLAASSAASASLTSLTPPALPRPPACTCALTTTRPPSVLAAARAASGLLARIPSGTGMPYRAKISLPWYSCRFILLSPSKSPGKRGHKGSGRAGIVNWNPHVPPPAAVAARCVRAGCLAHAAPRLEPAAGRCADVRADRPLRALRHPRATRPARRDGHLR